MNRIIVDNQCGKTVSIELLEPEGFFCRHRLVLGTIPILDSFFKIPSHNLQSKISVLSLIFLPRGHGCLFQIQEIWS